MKPRDISKPKRSVFSIEGLSKDVGSYGGEDKDLLNAEIADLKCKIEELEDVSKRSKSPFVQCFSCKKRGHYARDCSSGKAGLSRKSRSNLKEDEKSGKGSQD